MFVCVSFFPVSPHTRAQTQVAPDAGTTTVTEINVCPVVDCSKAERLGFPMDVDLKEVIRDYIKVYIKK